MLLILRIFITHITHKTATHIVPTLEMTAGKFEQGFRRIRIFADCLNILCSDIANRLVADTTARLVLVYKGEVGHRERDLQNVVKGLVPTIWQRVNTHVSNPVLVCVAYHIPSRNHALVAISFVLK